MQTDWLARLDRRHSKPQPLSQAIDQRVHQGLSEASLRRLRLADGLDRVRLRTDHGQSCSAEPKRCHAQSDPLHRLIAGSRKDQ